MPAFNNHRIPSDDLDDLMKYLKAVRKQQPVTKKTESRAGIPAERGIRRTTN
jgi:hypothetical protein